MSTTTEPSSLVVPFPSQRPPGFEWLPDEPTFDPGRHLALEAPHELTMLTDLGYSPEEISTKATPVAASTPFRVLSTRVSRSCSSSLAVCGPLPKRPGTGSNTRSAEGVTAPDGSEICDQQPKMA